MTGPSAHHRRYDQKEFVRTRFQVHRDRVCIPSAIEVDVLRFTVDFALFKSFHLHDRYLELQHSRQAYRSSPRRSPGRHPRRSPPGTSWRDTRQPRQKAVRISIRVAHTSRTYQLGIGSGDNGLPGIARDHTGSPTLLPYSPPAYSQFRLKILKFC